MPEYIKNISKKYKNYEKIIDYNQIWLPSQKSKNKKKSKSKLTPKDIRDMRSVIRSKTAIHDIVACNTFEYFVTLTISPKSKIDRYNYDDCTKHLSIWLKHNLKKYLLVPEKHKDNAYHFHLLADIPKEKLKHHKGSIYNIKSFKYGFSTAIKIQKHSEARIANYVTKYITKSLIESVGEGRKRYWSSKNLERPKVQYNVQIPQNAVLAYQRDMINIYHSPLEA